MKKFAQLRGAAILTAASLAATISLSLAPLTMAAPATAEHTASAKLTTSTPVSQDRLLPLQGGSNFRDLGGYQTKDGKTVRSGVLFRSGVMTGLTEKDEQYLEQFDFQAVVDLRSDEELALYPNHWVTHDDSIAYRQHSYKMSDFLKARQMAGSEEKFKLSDLYYTLPDRLAPQMSLYFNELLKGDGAVVVNCSAGQDRTGFASALLLTTLGVPNDVVEQDYLLSTQYRRPEIERGDVDLKQAAKTNSFAKMMLHYSDGDKPRQPQPLITEDGTPYIRLALGEIQQDYGSVDGYLKQKVGLSEEDLLRLRQLYLK